MRDPRGYNRLELREFYDVILMVSLGGPEGLDAVLPFPENVL